MSLAYFTLVALVSLAICAVASPSLTIEVTGALPFLFSGEHELRDSELFRRPLSHLRRR
jgi:hypothetical protein